MIMAILDAFGIATAGAPDSEADDVLGTLAERERRDPVVVVSGDRDLLQLVRDARSRCACCISAADWPRRRSTGPARSRRPMQCPSIGPGRRTRSWRCCVATRPTGFPAWPVSGRRPRQPFWRNTVRSNGSWPQRTIRSRGSPRRTGPSCCPPPITSTGQDRWCGSTPTPTSRCRRRRMRCRWSPPCAKVAELAQRYGVSSSIGRLQKALDSLPG